MLRAKPSGSGPQRRRPSKVMAKAMRAGFQRFIHVPGRCLSGRAIWPPDTDQRQLGSADAGGLCAELVADPGVTTIELDTLHRFEHDWEAGASLALRDGDSRSVDTYDRHRPYSRPH